MSTKKKKQSHSAPPPDPPKPLGEGAPPPDPNLPLVSPRTNETPADAIARDPTKEQLTVPVHANETAQEAILKRFPESGQAAQAAVDEILEPPATAGPDPLHPHVGPMIDVKSPLPAPDGATNEAIQAMQESEHFFEDVVEGSNRVKKHQSYFLELGVNPYRQAMVHLVQLHDAFDTRAGYKGKSTS